MQRINSYIGFAIKSNHIIKGIDDLTKTRKKVSLILVSNELKGNSKDKVQQLSNSKNIPLKEIENQIFIDLNLIGVKILGITDPNLAKAIIN